MSVYHPFAATADDRTDLSCRDDPQRTNLSCYIVEAAMILILTHRGVVLEEGNLERNVARLSCKPS